jgi:hypothetical protein
MEDKPMNEDIADGLRESFEETARWRREQALKYPDDDRNTAAAQSLERLAATVHQVDPKLLVVFGEEFADPDDAFKSRELLSERLRQIGFHRDYETATDFVQDFISGALREGTA